MQQAFIDRDAFQCGYCTPGQIMSAVALLEEGHIRTREEIREFMSGNLIDLMKSDVEHPEHLADLNALATNADTSAHPLVSERYPLLASAILAVAAPRSAIGLQMAAT